MTNDQASVGIIGMAVMGKNLALNIESRGYTVGVFNRTESKTRSFVRNHADKNLIPSYHLQNFVKSIKRPRRIIMMIKAGASTDAVIHHLIPLLDRGDILIDGSNANFHDTRQRSQKLKSVGIDFLGMGISGGELGVLHGPSLMPGGSRRAYQLIKPILTKIAAKADDGQPCVTYVGPDGAGHYAAMVHNGIEYGDEELIDEVYNLLRHLAGFNPDQISRIFNRWNGGELNSYLLGITADILSRKDDLGSDTSKPIVDMILDKGRNQGTGRWSSEDAMRLEVPQSIISGAVYARFISLLKDERLKAADRLAGPTHRVKINDRKRLVRDTRRTLYFSKIASYAQGFEQLKVASGHYRWHLHLDQLARIWRAGCIIQAPFLQRIVNAFRKNPRLNNLLLDPYFTEVTKRYQDAARVTVALATRSGIPVPCLSAAISYYDSYRAKILPANLLQAQRDYFGAHTYQRIDRPGTFHYTWHRE